MHYSSASVIMLHKTRWVSHIPGNPDELVRYRLPALLYTGSCNFCITNVYTYLIALVLLVYVSKLLTRRRYILFSDCRQSSIRELPSNIKGFNPCKNSADSKWRQILNVKADFFFSKIFTFLIDHILQSVDRIGWFCVG